MSRIAYCPACSAQQHGIKTRIPLEHTCGLDTGEINPDIVPIDELQAKFQKQNEALYPGELLRTSYGEFINWYATSPNPSAYEFFNFLLRQNKK